MNVVVGTSDDGFVENEWIGRSLQIGEAVRLTIVLADPRCVMTTLAQDDLPKDTEILRTLARHNRLEVAGQTLPLCRRVCRRGRRGAGECWRPRVIRLAPTPGHARRFRNSSVECCATVSGCTRNVKHAKGATYIVTCSTRDTTRQLQLSLERR